MAARTRRPSAKRFYEDALSAAERADLPVALEVEGMDQEIATLRLLLRKALDQRPEELALMLRGIDTLRKMVEAKYGLSKADQRELSSFAEETLRRLQQRGEGKVDG